MCCIFCLHTLFVVIKMRLTLALNHAKRFWWGKGWGKRIQKNVSTRRYKMQWMLKSKIQLEEYERTLPDGVHVEDPNAYIRNCLIKENDHSVQNSFQLPWPYSERAIKGSPEDPNYRQREALLFKRERILLDPINQSLVFTNTVFDNYDELPQSVVQPNDIQIDDQFIDMTKRRLNWCLNSDGLMRKLPMGREFPYLDQDPPRVWGLPRCRQENMFLRTIYDLSEIYIGEHYGYVDTCKISYPYCVVPFERDNRLVIFDLETDFITTTKLSHSLPLFSTTPLITIDKPLASIKPLEWPTCFFENNFYPIDYSFQIPANNSIQTIFTAQSGVSTSVVHENFIGKAIMYCYGYANAYARTLYGQQINDKELPDPIPIQCVFIDPKDFSVGFVCFQLNTTSFTSSIKNQAWILSSVTDAKQIMQNLIAFQLNGCVDSNTKKIKNNIQNLQSIS